MIPATLLRGIDPVAATKAGANGRGSALRMLSQFNPGDIFSAQVDARLPDGSYRVQLAGQVMNMALPSGFAAGDMLELVFVSNDPQPTFTLRSAPKDASGSAPTLSTTGRQLAALMLPTGAAKTPLAAEAVGALLGARPPDSAKVSGELAQTLSSSGLFYESHQAEWVTGLRTLAQIIQEPQARSATQAPTGSPSAPIAVVLTEGANLQTVVSAVRQGDTQPIAPHTLPLVQQQLVALDTATVFLQVEIWPKQLMQWAVEERRSGSGAEPELQQDWHTQLRLQLPRLGEVNATLSVGAEKISIRLDTDRASSATVLQENRASLQEALAAAGLSSVGIAITHHEPA
jgi:hypothetical protein